MPESGREIGVASALLYAIFYFGFILRAQKCGRKMDTVSAPRNRAFGVTVPSPQVRAAWAWWNAVSFTLGAPEGHSYHGTVPGTLVLESPLRHERVRIHTSACACISDASDAAPGRLRLCDI